MSLLNEMFGEEPQKLNERPYSRTQSAVDSAKGKVKGLFGSGQIEQGAQEVGAEANRLWTDFKRYIGRKYGRSQPSVSFADVAAFFKGNNLDVKHLGTNTRRSFTPKDVGNAILQASRDLADTYRDEREQEKPRSEPNSSTGASEQPAQQNSAPVNNGTQGGLAGELSGLSPSDRQKLLSMLK